MYSLGLPECLFLPFPSLDIDSGYYTVKFDSLLLKEAVVEGDSIIPPLRSEDAASSAESDEDSVDDSGYAKGESGEGGKCPVISACLSGTWNCSPEAFITSVSLLMLEWVISSLYC